MPDLQDAISLLEKGDAREASVVLEAMADEMPGYATAHVLLARAYEGLGEWRSALAAWRGALQIVPNSPVIRRGLERAARKATSGPPIDDLPELPSMSVSTPSPTAPSESAAAVPEDKGHAERDRNEDEAGKGSPEEGVLSEDASEAPDLATRAWSDVAGQAGRDVPLPPAETHGKGAEPEGSEEERDAASEPPPGDPAESPPDATAEPPREDQDLDRLIAELESARIVPRPDLESLPEPELEDDIEDVVSVTLARIYASQGQYHEAARVYDLLAGQQPDNEAAFKAKAAEMRSKAPED